MKHKVYSLFLVCVTNMVFKGERSSGQKENAVKIINTFFHLFMINLPNDLIQHITSYLELKNLLELSIVTHHFNFLIRDDYIWKMRCFNDFNYKPDKSWRCTSWKKLYISLRDLKVYAWKLDTRDRPNLISDIEER